MLVSNHGNIGEESFPLLPEKKAIQRIIAGLHALSEVYNWMRTHINKLRESRPPSIPLDFIIVQEASYKNSL